MHHHVSIFVVLSLLIAVLGSWTALDLFRRVRSHIGRAQRVWQGASAVAMGLSIWSMHFVAMLGFDPGAPVRYDPLLTFLSLALAVGATWGAFFAASKPGASARRLVVAGAAMGLGICLMHYVGMAALRTAASLGYRPIFVAASFAVAIVASIAALFAVRRERGLLWRIVGAVVLGLAIGGMHYTAMAGLELAPLAGPNLTPGAPPILLGAAVASGSFMILLLALLASLYDQRLNVLSALDAGKVGYWELTLPQMDFHMSARGKEIFGRDPDKPFSHAEILAALNPEVRAARDAVFDAALQRDSDYDAEYPITTPAGDVRWVNIRGRVVAERRGQPRRLAGVVLDVSDRRAAFDALSDSQARQRVLIDELNHRVKNTLATVQSIARQSVKGAASMADFSVTFEARLLALSSTHDALTRSGWSGAPLRELVEQEFAPYAAAQVSVNGPDLELSTHQALAIGMIIHELSTNAVKYGALSRHEGHVAVSWRLAGGVLELEWTEEGGPKVRKPLRRGFGTRLIEGAVQRELGGTAELSYPATGFQALLRFAVADKADGPAAGAQP